jgi:hypothetical protein
MKFKALQTLSLGAAVLLGAASTASADVHLTMQNGRVSIVAKDATVRQILTEWARVGQTKIVNVERIPGGPMSIELNNVPESQALEVLLRAMSGYIAAPRPVDVANLSRFDRIIVMPTLAGARPPAGAAPPPPPFQQTPQFTQPVADDDDDEPPPPNIAPQGGRGPVFNTFPQPQVVNPNGPMVMPNGQPPAQQPTSTAQPSVPGGVSVPGMIVQPPQPPPGQQVAPGQVPGQVPGQPMRRPLTPGGAEGRR